MMTMTHKSKSKLKSKRKPPPVVDPASRVSGPIEWQLDQGIWWGYQKGYITKAQPVAFGDPR